MHEPYKIIVVNAIVSIVLILGLLCYKFIYPKKKINLFILLIFIAILPTISIFRPGDYQSGDFNIHLYRTIDFFRSLSEGIFMPSWAENLNATYGYPFFIYVNPLPYYLISLFHAIGYSYILSMKIFLSFVYILSGIFMYLWARITFKNNLAAFTTAIFYLFSPYHLIDLSFRAAVGELTIFMTLPLSLLSIQMLYQKRSLERIIFMGLSIALLVLSHQAIAFFSIILLTFYTIFLLANNKLFFTKLYFKYLLSMIIGLGLAFYSLFPYLAYSKYDLASAYPTMSFINFWELFYSPWRWGLLFQGPHGELALIIGYTQTIVIIVSAILIAIGKHNKYRAFQSFWIIVTLVLIFMITPLSNFIWKAVPLIHLALLSTRLLLFVSIATSILAGILVLTIKIKKIYIYIFIFITIGYTILNWGHRALITTINDKTLIYQQPYSTNVGEGWGVAIPKWQSKIRWESKIPLAHLEIIKGSGTIASIARTSQKHIYISRSKDILNVKENTWFFPGWEVRIDDKQVNIDKSNLKYIYFSIPKGTHKVIVEYKDLPSLAAVRNFDILLISLIIIFYCSNLLKKRYGK